MLGGVMEFQWTSESTGIFRREGFIERRLGERLAALAG